MSSDSTFLKTRRKDLENSSISEADADINTVITAWIGDAEAPLLVYSGASFSVIPKEYVSEEDYFG